ncbi:MAG: FHA domain-containing protein [Verrucomicrobiota bacterium]
MAKLLFQNGGNEINLNEGLNRLGRHPWNDFPINDLSVSGSHCEITVAGDHITIRDLGSTNGTFIDDQPVSEAPLKPGQRLRLGNIELKLAGSEGVVSIPSSAAKPVAVVAAKPAVRIASAVPSEIPVPVPVPVPAAPAEGGAVHRVAPPAMAAEGSPRCVQHSETLATLECMKCGQYFCTSCVREMKGGRTRLQFCPSCGGTCAEIGWRDRVQKKEATFFARIPSAFRYPLRKDGWILLAGGALLYAFMSWLTGSRYGGLIRGLSFGLAALFTGYLFNFMQRIAVTSAQGEEQMPTWPEFTDYYQDMIQPLLLLMGATVVSFAPLIGCLIAVANGVGLVQILIVPSILLGIFYFPMSLLAVSLADSFGGLNPVLVVASAVKVAKDYIVLVILLGVLLLVNKGFQRVTGSIPIPILPALLSWFVTLYFFAVQMRLLGMMYYSNRSKLNWI